MPPRQRFRRIQTTEVDDDLNGGGATSRTIPALIMVGNAREAGQPSTPRLVTFDNAIEIGRCPRPDAGVDGWSLEDRRVSGRHARISRAGATFQIVDLESTNGTFVDGARITKAAALHSGAVVLIGGHVFVFRLVSDQELDAIHEDLESPFGPVATASPAFANSLRRLRRLARTPEEVLLAGETGVGKEVYARALHDASGRSGKFVALNCAALPMELVESELFGYARGAHSQAARAKPGLIEQAIMGTLFLDEIGDMPPAAQAKLLRFLQTREFFALGSIQARSLDVRIVGAAARLDAGQGSPGLRGDLAARLGAEAVVLPPLRDRPEDIGVLIRHFLERAGRVVEIQSVAFLALCLYAWPRNVRELEKAIGEAAAFAGASQEIGLEHLPSTLATRGKRSEQLQVPAPRRRRPRPAPSRTDLQALLKRHQGNVMDVARELDRHWSVVWRWIRRHGLSVDGFKGD